MNTTNVFCEARYYDTLAGEEWPYWPVSETEQMWSDVHCNQRICDHPVVFVGMTDIFGDGVMYYDGAAAWCYYHMPQEALLPEAVRLVRQAEWAWRLAVEKCLDVIAEMGPTASDGNVDEFVSCIVTELKSTSQAHSLSSELPVGRIHKPDIRYAIRPDCDVPNPEIALNLNCTSSTKE